MVLVNHLGDQLDLFFARTINLVLNFQKDIQNFIELKKIQGINLRIVEGRNKGKLKQQGLKMTKKNILHMISPQENVSPFDVNMACDAGYDLVIPYTNVNLTDVKALVQDAIFSRSVSNAKKTGVFICGKRCIFGFRHDGCSKKSHGPTI